ncbi:uncharacterized protein EV154DRAFT_423198 [Mucor mucedo]|uniref:uncharacterized protein n=1 Tax=Mucor mucedo TaxID=29922 RepID=UPI00221FBB8F|nr:uncharacterized protein EV154DRAFT_423198 [Mucor mucedo]KAI7889792.1 hypothetical protein EV154DRAFT_423198 [Mucor mucedo]
MTAKEPLPESDDDDFEKVSKDKSSDKAPAVKRGKKAKREETPETKEKTPESKETTPESRETTPESEEDEVYGASATLKSSLVIPHPKGSPFPDAISPSTLEFMAGLAVNNDRDYMRLHAKEWIDVKKDFIDFCGLIMTELNQADPSVLVEDAKNAMYRQHRDLRFSNDKRPYKTYLSGSFSAEGRKFERAGYFISLEPGNKSMVAAGVWQPDKYKLQRMRDNIIRHGDLLREALSTDAIIEEFDGESGVDILEKSDMLKVAPKGIERDHPEIELLRYRSFAVRKNFTDEEVVSAGFLDKVMDTYEALIPFIALINSWL